MTRGKIAGAAGASVLVLFALAVAYRALPPHVNPVPPPSPAPSATKPPAAGDAPESFLYGRITTIDGATYEGRLRWGRTEEAFWGDYFNGAKKDNPWAASVPADRLPKERAPIEIFGFEIVHREQPLDLKRLFMARFGDIARIQTIGRDVRVTLKSGAVFDLNRFDASDFDDGVRVWDHTRGMADLDSLRIRAIDLLPAPGTRADPGRLHGTVRTQQGEEFTGFLQWDREQCVGSDQLAGQTAGGERSLRFDTIRAIERRSRDSSLVTLLDGGEILLSGSRSVGQDNRGVYVDDPRYGRVLVSWNTFERVEFTPGGIGPAYGDFPPGGPLTGSVTTRDGPRLTGRLVYDLDESEFTETLDAPSEGVDYTIPLGLISAIEPASPRAKVTLHSGKQLQLEPAGDLSPRNGGILVFAADPQHPEYVSWTAVARITLDRPSAMYPALGKP